LERLQRELQSLESPSEQQIVIPEDPVEFAERVLGFRPYPYQAKLLRDPSKRIAVRMCRQAGKTSTIAVRAIWHAATHPRTLSLIVTPCLTPDTTVITNRGLIRAEDIRIGDLVLTHRGRMCKVVDKMVRPYQGVIYHFKNRNGEIRITPEHRLYVEFKGKRYWMTAEEIYEKFRKGEKILSILPRQSFK